MDVGRGTDRHDDVGMLVEQTVPLRHPVDATPEVLPQYGGVVDRGDAAAQRLFQCGRSEIATLQTIYDDGVGMDGGGVQRF